MQEHTFVLDRIDTPIGRMLLVTDDMHGLRALNWEDREARMRREMAAHYRRARIQLEQGRAPASVREPIERYLAGDLAAIETIPVETAGTPFQRMVWRELRRIAAGSTLSYSTLAVRIGRANAVRAVGLANGSNPISVVLPCHRVIGANGSLTGYGGGLERKRWLLEHEGVMLPMRHASRIHLPMGAHPRQKRGKMA